jgi:hypothetical protein
MRERTSLKMTFYFIQYVNNIIFYLIRKYDIFRIIRLLFFFFLKIRIIIFFRGYCESTIDVTKESDFWVDVVPGSRKKEKNITGQVHVIVKTA